VAQEHALEDSVKVAQDQLKVANSVLTANQDQVKQFAALQSAQIDLDHTKITAPVDVSWSRNVDVGQTVAASLRLRRCFDCSGPHEDAGGYQRFGSRRRPRACGPAGIVHRGRLSGLVFKGAVIAVREAPINVQNVITYDAVIGVSNPDLKLFPA